LELVGSMLVMMGRELLINFTSPLTFFLYLLLFGLVAWQYRNQQMLSASRYKSRSRTYLRAAFRSTLYGMLGGVFGSILLVFMGIDLSSIAITQLWMAALVLMLIQPRFLCFSYAAGILAVSNLLFGYPDVSIPQLMGLVAILHMVESLLILLNGPGNAWPVYIHKQGQLRGGFNMQMFWPLPLAALMSVAFTDLAAGGLEMPAWWPLLRDYARFADDQAFTLIPVLAVLGYGEISTSRTPAQASRRSSLLLFIFSLLLLLLALLSSYNPIFLPLAALFSPLGHELVIWLGMRAETRPPVYTPPAKGVMILDVISGSKAAKAGLMSRDIILQVDGTVPYSVRAFDELIKAGHVSVNLEIQRQGRLQTLKLLLDPHQDPGIILVPDQTVTRYLSENDDRIFFLVRRLWARLKSMK